MFSRQACRRFTTLLPVSSRLNPQAFLGRHASTLVLLESRDGKLTPDALSAIAAATHIQGPVTGLVLEGGVGTASAQEASQIGHLTNVVTPKDASTTDYVRENPSLSCTAKRPSLTY